MSAAPLPPDETKRLEILGRYAILDTLPQQQYDDLTFLAAQICGTPISLISLVDKDRQWFKSHYGLEAQETPREMSFCAHAILQNDVFEVPDATADPLFAGNALVKSDPLIRFYAGAPLVTREGFKLGTLCVIDRIPRHLTDDQIRSLEALARQTVAQMEVWRTVRQFEVASAERSMALQVAQETTNRLSESEARFRQFMDNSPALASIKDAQGRYVYINKPFEETFGTTLQDLKGKPNFSWLPRSIVESVTADERKVLESEQTLQTFVVAPMPDGREREWLVFKFRIQEASGARLVGTVALDITEQRRVEKLKSEFVSVISHELRTPLTSIRGALGLLAGGVAGPMPAGALQMIDIAQKNSERLVLLINDILDIEKIESGKMRFDLRPLDLRGLLESAIETNRSYAEGLGVTFQLDWDENDPKLRDIQVLGDENRLHQVLANLLSNGAKWTPEQGIVRLGVQLQDVGTGENATHRVRILVQDEGPGVPKDFVPQLFEKFAQADASSTRKQGGTGLGLTIARAIIEKHGGMLEYLRPEDRDPSHHCLIGALFAFDLGVERPVPAEITVRAPQRVLICEDEPEVAELLRFMIVHSGYEADIAATLGEARTRLQSEKYAGITLDLVFPDGDGLEFLAELRASDATRDLPVIVVSVHSESGKMHGQAFGVIDWLRKPIDSRRLVASLEYLRGPETPRVLHIEDDADVRRIMAAIIGESAHVTEAATLREARAQIERARESGAYFQLAILDIGLPDGSGLDLLPLLSACEPPVSVVLFSASEVSQNEARAVAESLVKSRTSNDVLEKTINRLLHSAK